MEELIKENSEFVETILKDAKISKKALANMVQIYKLKNDFHSINFSLDNRGLWWDADIFLKNRINSKEEFYKFLEKNNLLVAKVGGYGDEIYRPDYITVMNYGEGKKSELRCNFYNPGKISHKKQ